MTRKTHLVGGWPGRSGARAMDEALGRLGPHLLRLTDGETGERSQWVQPTIEWLRANPDVELVHDGGYTSYDDGPEYRIRADRRFDADNIELGYSEGFARSYRGFSVLRERHGQPQIAFQVGLPSPVDLAVVTFGFPATFADPSIAEAFADATLREIGAIRAVAGDDVVFQIETVFALASLVMADRSEHASRAEQAAAVIAELVANAPDGTRFGCHLCLGDFHHKAFVEMGDAAPIVSLTNAIAGSWPGGRTLEYVHVPLAAAEKPGSLEESWYAPLGDLDLPGSVRFVAGFIHEDLGLDDLRRILAIIESQVGREVDVAATCGLGRRPSPEQAWDAMDKAVALIDGSR